MMSDKAAKYKFSYCGEIFYVTREDETHVYCNGSNGMKSHMKKEDLRRKYFKGQVDFGCDTKPDFIEEKVTA